MPRLTKRVVDSLEARAADYFQWDDELPGFGVRVWPTGRKIYVAQYRAGRRTRRCAWEAICASTSASITRANN